MREPKIIYFCPIEELLGRHVVNELGEEGTITMVLRGENDPIHVQFKGFKGDHTYTLDGYYFNIEPAVGWIKLIRSNTPSEVTVVKVEDVKAVMDELGLSIIEAVKFVKALS